MVKKKEVCYKSKPRQEAFTKQLLKDDFSFMPRGKSAASYLPM
jgi:hypothetical protein